MSNFTCPTCGLTNIDCGKAGYKTAREIELEKQLKIAILALEYIKKLPVRVCCDNTAEQALKEIEAVNDEKSI